MRLIDANSFYQDICNSIDEMTKIGVVVNGEWLWTKLHDALDNAPTIEPEQRWIPCSERLPEEPNNYPYCEIRRCYYLVSLESGCVKTLGYEFDRNEWQTVGSPVVAWMPLPEPYRESE